MNLAQWEDVQGCGKTNTGVVYGAETRALKKAQDNTLEVSQMRMLR